MGCMNGARSLLVACACGAAVGSGAQPASAAPVVARVHDSPITTRAFDHWMGVAARSSGRKSVPEPKTKAWNTLRDQAMAFLISAHWITGETRLRHIYVSPPTVHRLFVRSRRQAFPEPGEFRDFLRNSGMTVQDVRYRVRLDELARRLRADVMRGHRGAVARQHALDLFVADFRERWLAKTSCAADYATSDCSAELPAPSR